MIYGQSGNSAFPVVEENEEVAFFETYEEAFETAEDHFACQMLGYEIFSMYEGVHWIKKLNLT